jgi:phosphatidylethanolamine-binding protein (PEBP) family uncharacterized protein
MPPGVQELALFAIGTRRNSTGGALTSVEWAMAGLRPSLHTLRAGEIPSGAFLLTDSDGKRGYSICPPRGREGRYTFALMALPRVARASPALAGPILLRNLTNSAPEYETPAAGVFSVGYSRG